MKSGGVEGWSGWRGCGRASEEEVRRCCGVSEKYTEGMLM
jgi:hypothetical protein